MGILLYLNVGLNIFLFQLNIIVAFKKVQPHFNMWGLVFFTGWDVCGGGGELVNLGGPIFKRKL